MSQLFTDGTQQGVPVRIHAGWDRPMNTAYFSTIKDGEYDLDSMFHPETVMRPLSFEDVQDFAARHGVEANESFWLRLSEHCREKEGNCREAV